MTARMNAHARYWRPGDLVSSESGKTLGTVVELKRRSDGRPFLMVEITAGLGTIGHREFPDHWSLGQGPREFVCLDCGALYRTEETKRDMCPACVRRFQGEHVGHGTGIQKPRSYLHGARTVSTPKPVDEETKARQEAHAATIDEENPFS